MYLERVVFIDEDYVIRTGELGRGMYFISMGTVEIFVRGSTVPMTTLGKHSFFGEMALLDRFGRSSGDVRVRGFCEGYHSSQPFCVGTFRSPAAFWVTPRFFVTQSTHAAQ